MRLGPLVLYARVPARTAGFYRALGVEFETRSDGRHVGAVEGLTIAIVEGRPGEIAAAMAVPGATMVGFRVASVDEAILAVHQLGGTIVRHTEALDWGRRAVVADPDGRAVELTDEIRT